jgi:hypothetical protein
MKRIHIDGVDGEEQDDKRVRFDEENSEEYVSDDEEEDEEDNELLRLSLMRAQHRVKKTGLVSPELFYRQIMSGEKTSVTFPTVHGSCFVNVDENNFASREGRKTMNAPNVSYICSSFGNQCKEVEILGKSNNILCKLYNMKEEPGTKGEMKTHLRESSHIFQGFLDSGLKIKLLFGTILRRTETYLMITDDHQQSQIELNVLDTWEYDLNFERDRKVLLIHMLDEVANSLEVENQT